MHPHTQQSCAGVKVLKITIEPGIYNEYGGVRIEDAIVVKKNGYVALTRKTIK